MLSITYSAFDFHILEFLLRVIFLRFLLLVVLLPRDARPEDDVLANRSSVEGRSDWMALLLAKFRPCTPLGYTRIDGFLDYSRADTPSCFGLLAVIIESIRYDSLCTIFVG